MTPDEFRAAGHQLVDWIADYRESLEDRPVSSAVRPGEFRASLASMPEDTPEPFGAVFDDLRGDVVDALTHWQSPNFFAYFPANASYSSVLGEIATAGLAVNGFSWVTSPAATELETQVMEWMRHLLGLPEQFAENGVIQDSASSATLCAVLAARHRASLAGHGDISRLVAYSTAQAHSSIEKGLRVAGIPADRVRLVAHDESFAMQPDALAAAIAADLEGGFVPFFCCAAAGSTSSLAIDPIDAIADVCERHDVWLHVDAAMAGVAGLCAELRWVNDGVDRAESYVTNAHKWLGVSFDCSLFWVADRESLIGALSILAEYLRSDAATGGDAIDYRDWQVPLGRRFRALKLWFFLRLEDLDERREMLRSHIAWAAELADWVDRHDRLELAAPCELNLVCCAHVDGNERTQALVDALNDTREVLVTPTVLDDRRALRVSIGSELTEHHHVERCRALLDQFS